MPLAAFAAPLWFVAAVFPMVASQILRLQQTDPATWIFWDYAGRLGALAVLIVIPSARTVAFRWQSLQMRHWEAVLWVVGLVLLDHYLGGCVRRTVNAALPAMVLGVYPAPQGWLQIIDDVLGLALVAFSEEVVFRRCARNLFTTYLGDGYALVAVTSILFGAYHWWTGIGSMIEALLMGVFLMLFYKRSAALWPVVLAHYLIDVVDFAL